ncbi:MAG: P-II family nitrogen regulator [Euryarchaeota archaeon]|nr:P-II family nitrogen regulator [Euryarchaeota archaeon]
MREVVAVIRRSRLHKTLDLLHAEGFPMVTTRRVLGRGREAGLKYLSQPGDRPRGGTGGVRMTFLPKQMVTLAVRDSDVERVVSLILKTNRTGEIGDGKIFVLPMDEAVRVRTGEGGNLAL